MSKYKFLLILGSPLHTWRILRQDNHKVPAYRITSTYVENTSEKIKEYASLGDHLHIRGEYGW